jgi:hypothetical protein
MLVVVSLGTMRPLGDFNLSSPDTERKGETPYSHDNLSDMRVRQESINH